MKPNNLFSRFSSVLIGAIGVFIASQPLMAQPVPPVFGDDSPRIDRGDDRHRPPFLDRDRYSDRDRPPFLSRDRDCGLKSNRPPFLDRDCDRYSGRDRPPFLDRN